jgi:hypothetical protein
MTDGIVKLLERMYQGFVLRDILGFVAPGSISLISLGLILAPKLIEKLWCKLDSSIWVVITFIVMAYMLAWSLQSLHYGIVNLVNTVYNRVRKSASPSEPPKLSSVEEIEKSMKKMPMVTRRALEPDLAWAKYATDKMLEKRLEDFPYNERLSALMLMSSNLAISLVLLAVAFLIRPMAMAEVDSSKLVSLLLFVFSAFLYCEHWRIWVARNLQVEIYAVGLSEKRQNEASDPKLGNQPQGGAN